MSKELWIEAHELAVEEILEANPGMEWRTAYESDAAAARADVLCRDRYAAMIDQARDMAKYR
jgi:hypothetical protein